MKLKNQYFLKMFPFVIEAIWEVINYYLPAVPFTINFKNCTPVYLNNRILDTARAGLVITYPREAIYVSVEFCIAILYIEKLKMPPWKTSLLSGGLIYLLGLPPCPTCSAACCYVITTTKNTRLGLRHMQLIANSCNAFSEACGAVRAGHKLTYPATRLRRHRQSGRQSRLGFLTQDGLSEIKLNSF